MAVIPPMSDPMLGAEVFVNGQFVGRMKDGTWEHQVPGPPFFEGQYVNRIDLEVDATGYATEPKQEETGVSDLEKAEALLKKFMRSFDNTWKTGQQLHVLEEAEEYFKKPVVVKDFIQRDVEISLDGCGDVCFEWVGSVDQVNHYFKKEELLRGLREIGVIE